MARLVPVVALVREDTLPVLQPTVDNVKALIRDNPEMAELCAECGWSAEALALGQLLDQVATEAKRMG